MPDRGGWIKLPASSWLKGGQSRRNGALRAAGGSLNWAASLLITSPDLGPQEGRFLKWNPGLPSRR